MAEIREIQNGRALLGRLDHGKDLIEELTLVATKNDFSLARLEGIGALQRARLGYYDQGTRQYQFFEVPKPLEITCLIGNVSLKDGEPIIHAHLTLADEKGHAFGGHLAPGCTVFACEFVMQELTGTMLERGFDEPTGLPLWSM